MDPLRNVIRKGDSTELDSLQPLRQLQIGETTQPTDKTDRFLAINLDPAEPRNWRISLKTDTYPEWSTEEEEPTDKWRGRPRAKLFKVLTNGIRFYPTNQYWREATVELGKSLSDCVMEVLTIKRTYGEKVAQVGTTKKHRLRLIFCGTAETLSLPFEFMTINQDMCVNLHPVSRYITGMSTRRPLRKDDLRLKLRILIVSSEVSGEIILHDKKRKLGDIGAKGDIPGPESEGEIIKQLLRQSERENQTQYDIVHLKSPTWEDFAQHLHSPWDIIHYAGHGTYEDNLGGMLFFRSQSDSILPVYTEDLKNEMRYPERLKFVFLSCCEGAASGPASEFTYGGFSGFMESLISNVGIPSLLGYRWKVSQGFSTDFAKQFYSLFFCNEETNSLQEAVFMARNGLLSKHNNGKYSESNIWAAPVLVVNENFE